MKSKLFLLYSIILLSLVSCVDYEDGYVENASQPHFYKVNWAAAVDSSTTSFVNRYYNTTRNCFNNTYDGQVADFDYWPEAHGLDVLVDAYLRTGDTDYGDKIYKWYEGVRIKNWYSNNWENEYYDDMGWHGLAHMRAFEATNDTRYENSARNLWNWITDGWSDYENGGIQWRKGADAESIGKGIPANGPAAIIAARRAQKYPDEVVKGFTDLEWAIRIYDWMKYNRTILSSGRVFENINNTNNDYAYDVGTYLGAAIELYNITGDKTYWNDALRITDYHIKYNINKAYGVMRDYGEQTGENGGGHDCNLFKGIFVRYFTILIQHPDLSSQDRARYVAFLTNNANYLWQTGTQKYPDIKFSPTWWQIPGEAVVWGDLRAATSAATTIEAMALLEKKGFVN